MSAQMHSSHPSGFVVLGKGRSRHYAAAATGLATRAATPPAIAYTPLRALELSFQLRETWLSHPRHIKMRTTSQHAHRSGFAKIRFNSSQKRCASVLGQIARGDPYRRLMRTVITFNRRHTPNCTCLHLFCRVIEALPATACYQAPHRFSPRTAKHAQNLNSENYLFNGLWSNSDLVD
jgi:hypothetical protein